jgi:hypothetical protein
VTFHVADGAQAHVTGVIDYVFYDWRVKSHRIIDYKLTPATHPNKDLFQIYTYALMHHHQHGTRPRVTVFYLHPERVPIEASWQKVEGEQHKIYALLASMVGWARYDEKTRTGLKPPGDLTYCSGCRWSKGGQCEARLGPKQEGEWDQRWEKLGTSDHAAAPPVDRVEPPRPAAFESEPDEDEIDDVGEADVESTAPPAPVIERSPLRRSKP